MSKLLYIKANAKPEGTSRTFQVSDKFIDSYKESHPSDEIITLELEKENINFLTQEDLGVIFGPKTDESKNHPILKYAYQFAEADKYVIAAPFWNLSIPAILKAYIDYISISGITFKYTENGPVGTCQGKKLVHIVGRGGAYGEGMFSDFEMGDRYLRTIMGFFGITDFTTIASETLDVVGSDVKGILEDSVSKAQAVAKDF